VDELRARRLVDSLRDRGVHAHLFRERIMTPKQMALLAELRAADYPAAWKLSASAADDKLVASATSDPTSARGRAGGYGGATLRASSSALRRRPAFRDR
jgi:hypothetical protein